MKYVLVGGGVSTLGAIEGIRKKDRDGEIVVISAEDAPIYGRPLISYMLAGKVSADKMSLKSEEYYTRMGVEMLLATRVSDIDREKKTVITDAGKIFAYDKLLLATGGRPFVPPIKGAEGQGVYHFTTLAHAKTLDSDVGSMRRAVVIGGGLIGLKAAESLFDRGVSVTVVELSSRVLSSSFDDDAASLVADRLRKMGLHLVTGATAQEFIRGEEGRMRGVLLTDGSFLEAEAAVLAIGVVPDTGLAARVGLDVDRGILVNERLRSSDPDIYASGDVAQAMDLISGATRVVPLWSNAYKQGFFAGKIMAGAEASYEGGLSMNAISFYGLPTTSVGMVNPPEGDDSYEVFTLLDRERQTYRKLVFQGDILVGYVLVGDIDFSGLYTGFIRFRLPITPEVKENLQAARPSALLWPEEFFDHEWNPEVEEQN